jgi:AraC family transcriptional regulator
MSHSDILANTSRGWNRDPAGVAIGTARTGLSAALWTHDSDDVQEVDNGGAPLDFHVISIQRSRQYAEVFKDGTHKFTRSIQPGTVSWMEAGVRPRAVHRGRWQVLHLYLPPALLNAYSEESGSLAPEMRDPECSHDDVIASIGSQILSEMHTQQPLSRLRIDALGQDLAIQLLRRWSNLAGTGKVERSLARGGLAPWQVKRVGEYLEANLASDVSLSELAGIAHLSPAHFCRAYKESTGKTPIQALIVARVERAEALLRDRDLPVIEVAAAVGYEQPGKFARVFRRATGLTPTEWRRERRS